MDTCDQAQGWTTSHCQDQDAPAAHRAEPDLRRRQLHRPDLGRRRRRRRSSCAAAGSRWSTRASSATGATRAGPTSAAPRCGCSASTTGCRSTSSTAPSAAPGWGAAPTAAALCSIGVSWIVLNSLFSDNQAIGNGANPAAVRHARAAAAAAPSTPTATVHRHALRAPCITDNPANEGGGAIFFVSNDRTGDAADRGLDAAEQHQRHVPQLPPARSSTWATATRS